MQAVRSVPCKGRLRPGLASSTAPHGLEPQGALGTPTPHSFGLMLSQHFQQPMPRKKHPTLLRTSVALGLSQPNTCPFSATSCVAGLWVSVGEGRVSSPQSLSVMQAPSDQAM
ncbi:hypothetical protein NDU88_001375 [Pleurodeles waltl]|uniref:Uncharacterized protein n=1 Tax=Pleurodeles waltl TaxID=8319 RepID=A0AAV7NJV8_PLEWA|nr:hypothetical protein NDU88_001375 [Pleurodeles waltl]